MTPKNNFPAPATQAFRFKKRGKYGFWLAGIIVVWNNPQFLSTLKNMRKTDPLILFMTDIAIIRDSVQRGCCNTQLIGLGIECCDRIYFTPEDALSGILRDHVETVIIDLYSKTGFGIDWMCQIKNHTSVSNWLVCSFYNDAELILRAFRSGATGFLLKKPDSFHFETAVPHNSNVAAKAPASIKSNAIKDNSEITNRSANDPMLSKREKEILYCTSRGLLYKEVADELGIQKDTVKKHLSKIYEKLQVQNKIEALNKFYGH